MSRSLSSSTLDPRINQQLFLDKTFRFLALYGLAFMAAIAGVFVLLPGKLPKIAGYELCILFGVVQAIIVGAAYLRFFYNLRSTGLALRYLRAAIFSRFLPKVIVEKGVKKVLPPRRDYTQAIGGPFKLLVMPDSAVVLESAFGGFRVLGAGGYTISRYETIKETVSLEEYFEEFDNVDATTLDGIRVKVSGVRFRFRVACDPALDGDCLTQAYPFEPDAVARMVYNCCQDGQELISWERTVGFTVRKAITGYINQHSLDELTTSVGPNGGSRADINNSLKSQAVRQELRRVGAELLWWDIGHFDMPGEDLKMQRVSAWQAHWLGSADSIRAEGEAKRQASRELGRAEAQADVVMNIINALEDLNVQADSPQNVRKLVLMRTSQLLEAMGEPKNRENGTKR